MRQIILDTETTGLEPAAGHRIIEIGCVELVNRRPTSNRFHRYVNPEREVDRGAKLHAVVRRRGVAAEELLDAIAGAQHDAPAAGPWVAATGAVGERFDVRH